MMYVYVPRWWRKVNTKCFCGCASFSLNFFIPIWSVIHSLTSIWTWETAQLFIPIVVGSIPYGHISLEYEEKSSLLDFYFPLRYFNRGIEGPKKSHTFHIWMNACVRRTQFNLDAICISMTRKNYCASYTARVQNFIFATYHMNNVVAYSKAIYFSHTVVVVEDFAEHIVCCQNTTLSSAASQAR